MESINAYKSPAHLMVKRSPFSMLISLWNNFLFHSQV